MPYGNYQPPTSGGYSANSVTSGGGVSPYTDSAFQQYIDHSRDNAGNTVTSSGTDPAGGDSGGGGGMGASGWMGMFQMIGDKLEGRRAAIAAGAAAQNDIPADPSYMKGFLDQMAIEGRQLKNSQLGARPKMEASAAGHNAAVSRGLTGPLAAAVQLRAVQDAQGSYNKWRQSALMAHRQMYMDKVREYVNALEKRKQAMVRAGYAQREGRWAQIPVGPIGKGIGMWAQDNGQGPIWDSSGRNADQDTGSYIQHLGDYNPSVYAY